MRRRPTHQRISLMQFVCLTVLAASLVLMGNAAVQLRRRDRTYDQPQGETKPWPSK